MGESERLKLAIFMFAMPLFTLSVHYFTERRRAPFFLFFTLHMFLSRYFLKTELFISDTFPSTH